MINEARCESLIEQSDEKSSERYFLTYLRWSYHSFEMLEDAENKILSSIKSPMNRFYVKLGKCVGDDDFIWTLSLNENSKNIPIVLLHGFAAGCAFWSLNLDELSRNHPVYVIDTLGFAKSSRPNFSSDPHEVEQQFVDSIEKWREEMGIDRMVLVGHSFGGYKASAYAMKYPDRLEHLVLADPWGYDSPPTMENFPFWKISLARALHMVEGPLKIMRAVGPFGEWLVRNFRPDLVQKFDSIVDPSIFSQYIFHCNSNFNASGERAFLRIAQVGPCEWSNVGHVWPLFPMGERMKAGISDGIPVTFIYGENTWVHRGYGTIIKENRPSSYTNVKVIANAGHHMYSDNSEEFNKTVLEACGILKSEMKNQKC